MLTKCTAHAELIAFDMYLTSKIKICQDKVLEPHNEGFKKLIEKNELSSKYVRR